MLSISLTCLNTLGIIGEKIIPRMHVQSYLSNLLYINFVGKQDVLLSQVFYWKAAFCSNKERANYLLITLKGNLTRNLKGITNLNVYI